MKRTIEIAQRICPFSHAPGTSALIPKTHLVAKVFPARLELLSLDAQIKKVIAFPNLGPLKEFTSLLDLEKEQLIVFGTASSGFIRYHLFRKENALILYFDHLPEGTEILINDEKMDCREKESRVIESDLAPWTAPKKKERLSLGSHKKLDWDLVLRRKDLREILPVLMRLSQTVPQNSPVNASLDQNKVEIAPYLLEFIQSGFSGILVPRACDDQHQGFEQHSMGSTIDLLHQGSAWSRSLFFQEDKEQIALLPQLPPEFHCGRYVGIQTMQNDLIDLEWSKKYLKKVIIKANRDRTLSLLLQKQIKSFRMRSSLKDRGMEIASDKPIDLRQGSVIYLDRFQK